MPAIKYIVDLTDAEREQLLQLTRRGRSSVRQVTRARVLLKANGGMTDQEVAKALDIGTATVSRTRQRFVEEGLGNALKERPRPGQRPKLTGKEEARLVAVACSAAPEGHTRWTLRLLADKVVELGFADSIARETVRQVLKKTNSRACPTKNRGFDNRLVNGHW